MIVSAHQAMYLPWLGYMDKLARADLFVVVDHVQYEAQNFQNRNRLKVNNGVSWVAVPLVHGPQEERLCDKRISNQSSPKEHWQRRTWQTILTHYRRSPHFKAYSDELEDVYTRPWDNLVELNLHVLQLLMRWFDIQRPVVRTSTLGCEGQKTDMILNFCRRVGATTYLSGSGGSRDYLDVAKLEAAGIHVLWQQFQHPTYPQRYSGLGFLPRLSSLDLILNCGQESRAILFGETAAESLKPATENSAAASGGTG